MNKYMNVIYLLLVVIIILTGCDGTESSSSDNTKYPEGTIENPLVLDGSSFSGIIFNSDIGNVKLYIKVINIPYLNNNHIVELTNLTGDLDLYTYSDAFLTPEESSTNSGTTDELCFGDHNVNRRTVYND